MFLPKVFFSHLPAHTLYHTHLPAQGPPTICQRRLHRTRPGKESTSHPHSMGRAADRQGGSRWRRLHRPPTVSETDNWIHAIYCVHKITMLCVWTLLLLLGCKIYEICWARFHMGYRKIAEYLIFSMISINVFMLIKSNSLLNYVCVQ